MLDLKSICSGAYEKCHDCNFKFKEEYRKYFLSVRLHIRCFRELMNLSSRDISDEDYDNIDIFLTKKGLWEKSIKDI